MSLWYWLLLVSMALLIPTAYAGKIGAPWVPVRRRAITRMLDELDIGKGDVVVDVGCGNGKVLIAAARRGAQAMGYELSPIMWFVAWLRTLDNKRIKVKYANFYKQKLPPSTTLVYAFLLPETLPELYKHVTAQKLPKAQFFVSYMFQLKSESPLTIFREENCGPVYVYDIAEKP